MSSFYTRAERFSPMLVRLLARKPYGAPMTTEQIAKAADMSLLEVEMLSHQASWDGVHLYTVQSFTRACGVDFDDPKQMRRVEDYLTKKPSFRYLRASPDWQAYYKPMLTRWRQSYGVVTKDTKLWPPIKQLLIRLNPIIK